MTTAVFQEHKSVNGWQVSLSPTACELLGVSVWGGSIDQYCRFKSSYWSVAPLGRARSWDVPKLTPLLRDAVSYTRETVKFSTYRPSRFSNGKRVMCATVAQIANERLWGLGPFWPGVETYGLDKIFAPLRPERQAAE